MSLEFAFLFYSFPSFVIVLIRWNGGQKHSDFIICWLLKKWPSLLQTVLLICKLRISFCIFSKPDYYLSVFWVRHIFVKCSRPFSPFHERQFFLGFFLFFSPLVLKWIAILAQKPTTMDSFHGKDRQSLLTWQKYTTIASTKRKFHHHDERDYCLIKGWIFVILSYFSQEV